MVGREAGKRRAGRQVSKQATASRWTQLLELLSLCLFLCSMLFCVLDDLSKFPSSPHERCIHGCTYIQTHADTHRYVDMPCVCIITVYTCIIRISKVLRDIGLDLQAYD